MTDIIIGNPGNWTAENPYIPLDKDGNWMHYPRYGHSTWLRVKPFYAEFRVEGMGSGRSAKCLLLKRTDDGITATMFISDVVDFLRRGTVSDGVLAGYWTIAKRGTNYGVKLVKP